MIFTEYLNCTLASENLNGKRDLQVAIIKKQNSAFVVYAELTTYRKAKHSYLTSYLFV